MQLETQALVVYLVSLSLIFTMKIACFILGYLTVRLGYQLISAGVKGEFKFSGQLLGLKADLASVSPGLLFVALGVFLIGYAIHVEKDAYIHLPGAKVQTQQPAAPPPETPVPEGDLPQDMPNR